jgi:undecaprenyl-diphosphatase
VLRPAGATSAALLAAWTLAAGGTMAAALVVEREHYPTDTVGGFCVAVTIVLVSALVIDWLADRAQRRTRPR